MANSIRITFKSFLPKSGRGLDGSSQQTKQLVIGEVRVSSYSRNGETLTPSNLDLFSIDYINLEVKDAVRSPGKAPRFAQYQHASSDFYVFDRTHDGTTPDVGVSEIATGQAAVVTFNAFGPARTVPELT